MAINDFFTIIKESGFNILDTYNKAPNETLILVGIIVLIIAVTYYFISSSVKVSNTLKLVEKMQDSKSYDDINKKLTTIIDELPKRGSKVSDLLNSTKEHTLLRTSKLIANMNISQKIDKYQELSLKYSQLAASSKKYNNTELTNFYEEKSQELLDVNLAQEIAYYCENVHFDEKEIGNVNSIVKYANTLQKPELVLDIMIEQMNRFSYGYNIDLFKFIEKLDEKEAKQIYKNANEKLDELFESGENEISINILDYLLDNDKKEKVYSYISSLKLSSYLQQLHDLYFDKKDDLDLDLAFIANQTPIDSKYKEYLDESLTTNWRNPEHIEYLSKASGVLDVLGHMEFRTLIERIDNIKTETENRRMVEEALAIAKRAESIALEAKSLNKRPVIMSAANSENK